MNKLTEQYQTIEMTSLEQQQSIPVEGVGFIQNLKEYL